MIVGAVLLILGGLTKEDISKTVLLVDGIIIAVGALITAIVSYVTGKELKNFRANSLVSSPALCGYAGGDFVLRW